MMAGIVWVTVGLLFPLCLSAHDEETIQSIQIINETGYVIDSDGDNETEPYNRDAILAQANVLFTTQGDALSTYSYRIDFRLIDSDGVPVPIKGNNGQDGLVYSAFEPGVILPISILNLKLKSTTRNYQATLKPAVKLDPYVEYRVEATLFQFQRLIIDVPNFIPNQELQKSTKALQPAAELPDPIDILPVGNYVATGDALMGAPKTYYHFRNLLSADAPVNVIAELNQGSYSQTYRAQSVAGKDAFRVEADYTLRRYDAFSVFPFSTDVTVLIRCELRETGTNALIPLEAPIKELVKSVSSHGIAFIGNPIPPTKSDFLDELELRPTETIDSINNTYHVVLTIEHVDLVGKLPAIGNSLTLADQRFLDFNGVLTFGAIQTEFTSIANQPVAGALVPNGIASQLAVNNNSGFIVGHPDYKYGNGTPLNVVLHPDGVAEYTGAGNVSVIQPIPDVGVTANVRFNRSNMFLNTDGLFGDLRVILPTGLGFRSDTFSRILKGTMSWMGQPLKQDLAPLELVLEKQAPAGTHFYMCEESKPFWIESDKMRWIVEDGKFHFDPTPAAPVYVRGRELDHLENVPLESPKMKMKRSNLQYFRYLDQVVSHPVEVEANDDGASEIYVDITFKPGQFATHFPYDSKVEWNMGGLMSVKADQVDSALSGLDGVVSVGIDYARDCSQPDCGPGQGLETFDLEPVDARLVFSKDGGLVAQGSILVQKDLTWGWINEPNVLKYAQSVEPFADGVFHMPGGWLGGKETTQNPLFKPAVLLFTGTGQHDPVNVERYGTAAYEDGFGDYAGLNFRVEADGAKEAESVLAAQPTGLYPLEGRSKYYVRKAGVSGIHEAVFGAFPSEAQLYGYDFKFTNYGLAYLDSLNVDSRTEGTVHVDAPSDFDQNFEKLMFSCLGALEEAEVPADEAGLMKELAYWIADFSSLAILFDRKDGAECDPGEGFLTLGVEAYAQHVDSVLYGTLGFYGKGGAHTAGNLITFEDNTLDPPFNSRLKLPNNFQMDGPDEEVYQVTPVADAFLNNYDHYNQAPGFINIAATMDVPFFEDLKIHMHTSADKDGTTAPVYLMGGWPDKGFELPPGTDFFSDTDANPADPDNRGFPDDTDVDGYREGDTDGDTKYLVRAQRNWLGVVDLDYPLDWSTSTRVFQSYQPIENDLLVLNVEHQAKYISPENVELTFGVQYDGLPTVNLVNMAFDELSGASNALNEAIGEAAREAIDEGMEHMEVMLRDQAHDLFGQAMDDLLDPVIDNLYAALKANYDSANKTWVTPPLTIIQNYANGGGGIIESFEKRFSDLIAGGGAGQMDLVNQVDDYLADVENALNEVQNLIAEAPDGSRTLVANLVRELVGDLAAQFVGAIVDSQLDAILEEIDPTLDQISEVIGEMQDVLSEIRGQLQVGQSFVTELQDALNSSLGQMTTAASGAANEINEFVESFNLAVDDPFTHYEEEDFKEMIRLKLEDQFFGSQVVADIQEIIKQRLYDVDAAIQEGIDSIFQQVNNVLRDLINPLLAELDDSIGGFLGEASSVMGAGSVNGYAHINGDSLKLLRLDIYAQLQVPSEMEFNAYLQVKELDSDGTPTECLPASGRATEVTMGATDVEVGWISPDLRANVDAKFTFDPDNPLPGTEVPTLLTMGAGFELTGEINFETFKIKYLGASMAFGSLENYFSCAARISVNKYEGMGGLMFGKSCSLDPFFWDPDIQGILGAPPFTGAYMYAEVWIPVSEALLGIPASCFFQVSAGVGAGAGYFVEGPTYIGKMFLGVSGEVLCIVSVSGDVTLVGVKNPDGLTLAGKGSLRGEIGACPFCISFSKTLGLEYKNNSWDVDF
jgi:hypothetical protein